MSSKTLPWLLLLVCLPAAAQVSQPGSGGSAFNGGSGTGYQDAAEIASPGAPVSGADRLYFTTSHQLACITAASGNCLAVAASAGGNVNTLQFNSAAALGGVVQFTTPNGTTTIAGGSTAVFDMSAAGPTTGLKMPLAAGAAPTADGFIAFNSTTHLPVFGNNGATITLPTTKTNPGHNFLTTYTQTTGAYGQSQPGCADISDAQSLCNTTPGANVATFIAAPSSANLAAALTDEVSVGTGKALFATAFLGTDANAVTGTGVFSVSNMACGDANAGVTPCLALPSGMTATTQTSSDNTTDVATDAFVQAAISGISGGLPSLPTGPNGVPEVLNSTPSGGVGGSASWGLAGVPFNNNSETTCSGGTLSALDRATAIFCSGGTTATFTLPVHTTSGLGSNFPFVIGNNNSGTLTMTPTTDTIDNGTVLSKWASFTYNDASGNWHTLQFPQFAAFGSTCTNGLTWSTSTGFSCASSAPLVSGGALGTPSSGTGTSITGIPAANVLSGTLASGMAASTQSADDNSTKLATTAYVDRMKARTVTFTFGAPEGAALSSPLTRYVTVPFGCTISAYNLLADAGTFTVKFWKIATGTAIPTVSNSISTSGLSLASGTALHSTTLTDFTTTTVASNDIIAANLTTVATAKMVQAQVECDQ